MGPRKSPREGSSGPGPAPSLGSWAQPSLPEDSPLVGRYQPGCQRWSLRSVFQDWGCWARQPHQLSGRGLACGGWCAAGHSAVSCVNHSQNSLWGPPHPCNQLLGTEPRGLACPGSDRIPAAKPAPGLKAASSSASLPMSWGPSRGPLLGTWKSRRPSWSSGIPPVPLAVGGGAHPAWWQDAWVCSQP